MALWPHRSDGALKMEDNVRLLSSFLTLALVGICIGADQKPVSPRQSQSIARTKDKDQLVRQAAGKTQGNIDPEAKAAIPALTELLKDKDGNVRWAATWALGNIGPKAKTAVPALTELLHETDWSVRWAAAESLGNIGPEATSAIPAPYGLTQGTGIRIFARRQPKPCKRSRRKQGSGASK